MDTHAVNARPSIEELTLLIKLEEAKAKTAQATRQVEEAKAKTAQATRQAEEATRQAEEAKEKAEEAKQKTEQEKQKTKQLELQCKKRRTDKDEDEGRKRRKIGSEEDVTMSSERHDLMTSSISGHDFYKLNVKLNIHSFDITDLLHDYNDVNEDMINVIKNNFDHLKSIETITEEQIQNAFNQSLIDLFSQFHNSTSLKYLDTHNISYLRGAAFNCILKGKAPDCSFIYKNVNINVQDEYDSLRDFLVCIGELKQSGTSAPIDEPESVRQLLRYLTYILKVQQRRRVYGFITNITNIRFYYAEQLDEEPIVYYQSQNFEMFNYLLKTTSSSSSSVNRIDTSARTRCFDETTLKILIKFLTMDTNFYGYTTLNINADDYLYDDKFYIRMRSGNGATSFVYSLGNNNQSVNNSECSIIKISKHDKYSKYFINEVKILEKLKQSDNSNNFDLFFENVYSSSLTGKICLLK
jgi:hypothetical protein